VSPGRATVRGSSIELLIETHGLTKRYRSGILAVDGLDLKVERGEVYGFLGPNGAGKTTTMRMLVGLMRPTSGSAVVAGAPPGKALARVGSLVEAPAFYPYLSAWDNLRLLTRYADVPEDRIGVVLDEVDLRDRAGDKYSTFSLGMKQRLGVAAALLKDPDLLILDEPSNGLDPQGIAEMRELVRGVGRGDRTVLLSSHQLNEVEQVCDRVGVIAKGQLVAEGTLEELRGQTGLIVAAAPAQRAGELLTRLLSPDIVHFEDGKLRIDIDPSRAAEINRTLVRDGIDVSELRPAQRSLEDIFFALTGDGASGAAAAPAAPAAETPPAQAG
jgi:ABC-type multidrug transport system ATPase subunit